MSDSLRPHGLHSPWYSPGQNTGVGSLSLLQGTFPTQRLNPSLLHCRWILYQLSHKGSPRIFEWVAYPFSRGSSQLRNWTRVSCISHGFFTNWAIREAICQNGYYQKDKCWQRYGVKGTLRHCWWDCKLVRLLWRIEWSFLKKLKIELSYHSAIPFLGICLKETKALCGKISAPSW